MKDQFCHQVGYLFHPIIMRYKLICLLPLLLSCASAFAQIDPNRGINSTAFENLLSARIYQEHGRFHAYAASGISDKNFNMSYAFQHLDSKTGDGAHADSHTVTPAFYVEVRQNYSLTASFSYVRSDSSDKASNKQSLNGYGPALAPAIELLHFAHVDTSKTSLTLELDMDYLRGDSSSISSGVKTDGRSDTFDIGPALTFVQVLIAKPSYNQLSLVVRPGFDFDTQHQVASGSSAENSHSGLFSYQTRLVYGFNANWYLGAYGTWEHYISQSPASGQSPSDSDWAQFGGSLVYRHGTKWNANIGYYYEAFNSGFDSHNVSAYFEYHF